MEKMKMHTPNFTDENIAKIAELFPNCVTEAQEETTNAPEPNNLRESAKSVDKKLRRAIDFDLLKQELSRHIVDGPKERYHLNWPGKKEALLTANAPIAKTLRPCREESVEFDITENLFIEGDNLDALKLLQESYLGKVKMIYIDPPYNTGNDFIYADNFAESTEEYLLESGQKDEEGNRLIANSDANGRFHSDWLSMMYSRLKLAKNLLKDDGVIFISIDDNEMNNLNKLCDIVFGEENNVARLIWEGANKNDAKHVGIAHEYVLAYAKSKHALPGGWRIAKEGTEPVLKEVARLKKEHAGDYKSASKKLAGWFRAMKATQSFGLRRFSKIDERGAYKEDDPTAPGGRRFELKNPNTGLVIPLRPNRGWGFDQETFNSMVDQGRISFVSETSIMVRRYLHETDTITPPSVFYQPARSASERLGKLFGKRIFDFPKDESIISKFIEMATGASPENAIILDFFAGSATTAHAVMQLNAKDGGNRKFIMVQLPEECDEKSEAFKAGYSTIAEISKERIRRAGARIKDELGKMKDDKRKDEGGRQKDDLFVGEQPSTSSLHPSSLDTGFRVLKVDSGNLNEVYYNPDALNQSDLFEHTDNLKDDRTAEDLLFHILLDWGLPLDLPFEKKVLTTKGTNGHEKEFEVFFVDGNAMAVCLVKEGEIDEAFCKVLAAEQPLRVVFRDAGFKDDSAKINAEQIFKLLSPDTELKTI